MITYHIVVIRHSKVKHTAADMAPLVIWRRGNTVVGGLEVPSRVELHDRAAVDNDPPGRVPDVSPHSGVVADLQGRHGLREDECECWNEL